MFIVEFQIDMGLFFFCILLTSCQGFLPNELPHYRSIRLNIGINSLFCSHLGTYIGTITIHTYISTKRGSYPLGDKRGATVT